MSDKILSNIAVYNHDTYVHVSLTSESNVGMSFIMLIINQQLCLEIAISKFFKYGYGKYQNLHLANSINEAKNTQQTRSMWPKLTEPISNFQFFLALLYAYYVEAPCL